MHWFDELYTSVGEFLGKKESVVCNAGLSVSGLQHVGRLRGEIVLNHFIATRLREAGREVLQHLVVYTQDPWKGTEGQIAQFEGGGEKYVGWRLIDVPDPEGCHPNWVDHYWEDFGETMDSFAPGVVATRTTEIYKRPEMKEIVRGLVSRAEEVRVLVNRYRSRNPHPEGWLPFDPFCTTCKRIGRARALQFNGNEVEYECECGGRGRSPLEKGKLNWRLEWPALWAVLQVDVEPFGKDHAAPGGSRESCQVLAQELLEIRPPFGIPYEWVGYSEGGLDKGDMGSSDFLGFGPRVWLELADPEVFRFLVADTPIRRRMVLDMARADQYHQSYDLVEAAHYAGEGADSVLAFRLAQLVSLPEELPFQLGFRHAALLAQVAPEAELLAWSLKRLRDTGLLQRDLSPLEENRVEMRLQQAKTWVAKYGPDDARVQVLERLSQRILKGLTEADRRALSMLRNTLSEIPWKESSVKEAMVELTGGGGLPVPTRRFFEALYTVLLGKPSGPRAAPILVVLDRDFVLGRLDEAGAR